MKVYLYSHFPRDRNGRIVETCKATIVCMFS